MGLFRVTFTLLRAPRVSPGTMTRKVHAVGLDGKSEATRTEIKRSLCRDCECGFGDLRLRRVVGDQGSWDEDTSGPDTLGIVVDQPSIPAVEQVAKPPRFPTREELFAKERTMDELKSCFDTFKIPADAIPDAGAMLKEELAEALDKYFRPVDPSAVKK